MLYLLSNDEIKLEQIDEKHRGHRLLLYLRQVEMIVNDIHIHLQDNISAVSNKTPFHYTQECSRYFGGVVGCREF